MERRTDILGVGVSPINLEDAVGRISAWIREGRNGYVCVANVHSIMESRRDQDFRRILNDAGMVTPDGMPLVWLGRRRGDPRVGRVYGPDLMLAVCRDSVARGFRHFFYGGASDEVLVRLRSNLEARFPGLQVAGALAPPFRPLTEAEDAEVVERIRESGADIVWVGLGAPRQERWMAAHAGRIPAVMVGVGAAFDFHAGVKRQAPRVMQRTGLEWLFRLGAEPRRLWRRYLVDNPAFAALIFMRYISK